MLAKKFVKTKLLNTRTVHSKLATLFTLDEGRPIKVILGDVVDTFL